MVWGRGSLEEAFNANHSHLLPKAEACPAEQSVTTERYGLWEWTPRRTCCWLVGGESCWINMASS